LRTTTTGRSARALIRRMAGLAALSALAAPLAMSGPALADTGFAGYVTQATTPTQTNVAAPNATEPDLTGLSSGDTVAITVSGPAGTFFGMEIRQCRDMGAADIGFNSEFVPDGGNCIDIPFTAGTTDSFKSQSAAPTNTTATANFRVGTGTRSFNAADAGPTTITCDDTHPCDLWIKEAVPVSVSPDGINWVHYDLAFAAAATNPGPPTAVTSTAGDTTCAFAWTPPANTGNRPLNQYTVTVSPGALTQNVTPPLTSASFTGLTNGTSYTATVTARNTANLTSVASAPSPACIPAQVLRKVTQTITAERPTGALVLTQVCGAHGAVTTGTAPTITGGGADPLFADYPYPTDAAGDPIPNYPTSCAVDLGKGKLITTGPGAGQYFKATGLLSQVTVVDTRDSDPGWVAAGQMGSFSSTTSPTTFGGGQLGWHPIMTSDSPAFTPDHGVLYDQTVVGAADTTPGTPAMRLGSNLATAGTGVGLGISKLDADLTVWIPIYAKNGIYTGTLTITAV
jgi:hypothetical protein